MAKTEIRQQITLGHEGGKLFGVLHRPLQERQTPVVLLCHGFAGTKVGHYRMYVRLSQALSSVGIASLRVDFRGCGDSEGEFVNTTIETQVADALVALDYLLKQPWVDAKRVGILGCSLGGAVAVIAAKKSACIKSLALWAAVFHGGPWKSLLGKSPKALDMGSAIPFQGQWIHPHLVLQILDLNLEDELKDLQNSSLLCIHSEKDEIVDVSHAEQFQLHRAEVACSKFIRLSKSFHNFSDCMEQEETLKATVDWFTQTL